MSGPGVALDPRTRTLLEAPILPTLVRLAWPNLLVMLAQASTGLIETYWVGKLGTDALAGMALVFPGVMLMQMLSGGALGGGISSAVARALGGGRREDANALVLHAIVINALIGAGFSVAMLLFGRPFYRALGGEGASLEAALAYSNVVFCGNTILFVMNALASVLRGTGNMLVPALVTCIGVVLLLPLSPILIFGWGPVPALGVAGGGFALLAFYVAGAAILAWYLLAGRSVVRPALAPLRWRLSRDILRIGAVAAVSSIQTNVVIGGATALVGLQAGAAALAGFGTGARLEYLLVPLVFGIGAPLVAMVGTSVGAGRHDRALRVAWSGCALAFVVTETVGIAAAIWPRAWLGLFGTDPAMLDAGAAYLRAVGPFYGFFGIGLSLYFASQGAGRLLWPLVGGFLRMIVALGGGWIAMRLTGRIEALYVALALGLLAYGVTVATAVARGVWFARPETSPAPATDLGPARA
ncbi:MATE family efflux transporter [Enterovirga sp. CN4-39]|uniref:MATE family efflux transporter n=1 Tax=Enterovirga sp. CN4-39 TaxID=3400910 RepID=UPI003C089993